MKKVLTLLLVLLLVMPYVVFAEDNTENNSENEMNNNNSTSILAPNAKSAIIVEFSTGKILYENNSHERMAPASMTKMMSLLLIMESIENGTIKWDDVVTVSENASSMGGSQILLEIGEEMSVEDLVKGVSIASGNDAVVIKKQSQVIEGKITI